MKEFILRFLKGSLGYYGRDTNIRDEVVEGEGKSRSGMEEIVKGMEGEDEGYLSGSLKEVWNIM